MVGNIPNFTKIDILRCFLRFNKNISRKELASELELGEGTVRSILEILKEKKFLDSTKKGHFLSKTGKQILNQLDEIIIGPKSIASDEIYPQSKKTGILIRNVQNLKGVYKLRDIAVKNGADGAIILKFEEKLHAPESDYSFNYKNLEKYFDFKNNDVLVIAFSNKKRQSEIGSIAIAIELSDILKKFISVF